MKILKRYDFSPKYACPGDSLSVVWDNKTIIESHPFKKREVFDHAIIFEIEDGEFGLEHGFGGIIGRKRK